ncbi:heparinase II/III family protein [Candidatus Dependentiae bacterium]|nr:heparinase II/III family protein [Candidatus Dependentiae bacterium]
MQIYPIISRVQKAIALGPRATVRIAHNRLQGKLFSVLWRYRALRGLAGHSWTAVAERLGIKDVHVFMSRSTPQWLRYIAADNTHDVLARAQEWMRGTPELLGGRISTVTTLPWHEDFRLKELDPASDYTFSAHLFYQDITISVGTSGDQLAKDIKVPWELSRFQHLLWFGQAYQKTGDTMYVDTWVRHIDDWMDKNPYLLGINWVCPMEVGLRAINWIISWWYFRTSTIIPTAFWQKMLCSLYDHMHYLENNWELYDGRTSNHYLSDLVGYLYLCSFFNLTKKASWCFEQIQAEMRKQVFPEGTSYEGSTAYHRLVTELFLHAYMLARELHIRISDDFEQRLTNMGRFIAWCSPRQNTMVTIGDHDSGQVTAVGITQAMQALVPQSTAIGIKTFYEFGLSCIKNTLWHITLRHQAYKKKQPSGHFHNDVGSVTLAIRGIPVLIDPGSYVYTPSVFWRNYFRSAAAHTTVTLQDEAVLATDERLFNLDMQETCLSREYMTSAKTILSTQFYVGASNSGVQCARSLKLAHRENILFLSDSLCKAVQQEVDNRLLWWNFILAPNILAQPISAEQWLLFHRDQLLATMWSPLPLERIATWASPAYGIKCVTHTLRGTHQLSIIEQKNTFNFSFVLE